LFILAKDGYLEPTAVQSIIRELEEESRMLLAFIRKLKS